MNASITRIVRIVATIDHLQRDRRFKSWWRTRSQANGLFLSHQMLLTQLYPKDSRSPDPKHCRRRGEVSLAPMVKLNLEPGFAIRFFACMNWE
jgi:hypothetical protein